MAKPSKPAGTRRQARARRGGAHGRRGSAPTSRAPAPSSRPDRGPATPQPSCDDAAAPPPAPEPLPPLPVVAIGASAGGLEALQKFFGLMPSDSGMAFVVVQHLDPRHTTVLPELLGRTTRMSVEQVKDETPVQADHVYVIPPNATLAIEGGLLLVKSPAEPGLRMPIDGLFHSLAEDQGERAICIVMSGTGTDGTLGLRAVKGHGGMTMAQSPESAKHDTMLRSAIGTGVVDHVLPPEEMPARLVEYAAHLFELHGTDAKGDPFAAVADQLARICALLRRKTGHDFSRYKTTTLVRRIQRRMQVRRTASVAAYVESLRQDPKEADQLFRDLLIGVTQFFRDPQAFAALEREVIPRLFEHAGADGTIRVWTPGCATGEETYSVAILLREEMRRSDLRPRVQIFAGDIDNEALEFARQARYPEGIAEHVAPERLARYFTRLDHGYQVTNEVRELSIFSTHNLIRDPPFSRLDLIVCRNLLIYLETDMQRHVTNVFHFALRRGGYLFLGPSENVVGPAGLFHAVDKKHHVFRRSETIGAPAIALPFGDRAAAQPPARLSARVAVTGQPGSVTALERLLLDHYAPAWVIVNAQGESVYFSPRTGRFLEPPVGVPSADVVGMARKGLRLDLRAAIHKAVKTGETVVHERVAVETNGDVQQINLIVRPLAELGPDSALFLVVFQEIGPPRSSAEAEREGAVPDLGGRVVQQLESELRTTKEHLQATIEEVETSNEELKSSNEELLSTNEELQSTNEELQTSKEELQSVNEELETINHELNKKLEELNSVNSDLQNLLQSTQIPTLFLDGQLRIKRFTEAATSVFRLQDGDEGRPIMDIAPRFGSDIVAELREVLHTLATKERQVSLADGSATYLMRVRPYRRVDNVVDGLVVAFLDVTQLNRAALEQQARLASIVESSQDAIVGRGFDGTILTWNPAAEKLFGYAAEEARGRPISLIVPPDEMARVQEMHERVKQGVSVAPYESMRVTRGGERLTVSVAMSPLRDAGGGLIGVSSIFRDITELKRVQEALRKEGAEKDKFLAVLSHELRNPLAPLRTSLELLRRDPDAAQRQAQALAVMDRQLSHLTSLVDQLMDAARISSGKIVLDRKDLDVVELVRAVVEDHAAQFEAAGLRLEASLPERPLYVSGDRLRLAQALDNLLTNAAKFTPQGGKVSVDLSPDVAAESVFLTVADTGVGIEPGMGERLFQPFAQAATTAAPGRSGLGLGLALVRGLAESHGGSVQARSEGLGRGARFTIRLPLLDRPARAVDSPSGQAPADERSALPRRVLVVEDNSDAADSLRRLLELWGHDVAAAANGRKALELARELRPEVVLCDLQLPGGLDGFGVARAIRSDSGLGRPLLVALTAFGLAGDRERSLAAGFDRHMTKPADSETLRRLIDEFPRHRSKS